MKKYLFLTVITFSLLFLSSCEKYCSCTAPGENPTTVEIAPTENCADISGGKYGECHS